MDYITKPFQHEKVLARITTHLTLQRLKQKLADSEERLSRILESAMDAIITFDRNGCITMFNQAAERVYRCEAQNVIGHSMERLLADGLRQLLSAYLEKQEQDAPHQMWIPEGQAAVRGDGEKFPLEGSLSGIVANG